MRKYFILFAFVTLITCGGFIYNLFKKDSVQVYTVEYKLFVKSIYATGIVKKGTEVEVKSQVAGYIEKIFKDTGERVKKGEILAVIKNEPLKKEIEQVEERIKRISEKLRPGSPFRKSYTQRIKAQEEKINLLKTKLKRREQLYKREIISKESYEELKAQYESELYNFQALKEEYKKVIKDLENELKVLQKKKEYLLKEHEKYKIKSPINGVILKRNVEVGDYINTFAKMEPLFIIGEQGKTRTFVEIDEEYAPLIKEGQKALVKLEGYSDRVFLGKVKEIHGKIDEKKRTLTVELSVNYDVKTISGMSVEANIVIEEKKALAIPVEAVKNGYVILLKENKKIKQKVEIGERFKNFIEVLSGLKEGDKILIEE